MSDRHDNPVNDEELNRFWNDLAAGRRPGEEYDIAAADMSLLRDFHLRGTRLPSGSARERARLKAKVRSETNRIEREHVMTALIVTPASGAGRSSNGRAAQASWTPTNSGPRSHPQRGTGSFARFVSAAVLLLVIFGGYQALAPFRSGDDRPSIPAAVSSAGTPAVATPTVTSASPTATAAGVVSYPGRDVPSPAECTGTPYRGIPAITNPRTWPDPGTYPFAAPSGVRADAETVAAVTKVVRGETACFNAGDILRVFAFWTDQRVVNTFGTDQLGKLESGATYDAIRDKLVPNGTVTPLPEASRTAVIAVLAVEVLEPGWVGAYVVVDPAGAVPAEISYDFFQQTSGGWKIDSTLCYNPRGTEGC